MFLAELGDKTQLATLLFVSEKQVHPLALFATSSLALFLATALAVLVGHGASRYPTFVPLRLIAGIRFVAIGLWTIWDHVRSA